jgi:hypothetical protein
VLRQSIQTHRMIIRLGLALALLVTLFCTTSPAPQAQAAASTWLSQLNAYRAQANLPPVTENTTYSAADALHAQYTIQNNMLAHSEDPSKPGYSDAGNLSAARSNVYGSYLASSADTDAIDMWMTGPFHGPAMIDPRLTQVGFSSARDASVGAGRLQMAAALDIMSNLINGPTAAPSYPVMWPANGNATTLRSFNGVEWPSPLTSCPGYTASAGLPIYLLLGSGSVTPNVTAHSLLLNGLPIQHCEFDETNYTNTDLTLQSLGRNVLGSRDTVVLLPHDQLVDGTYTASVTVNGQTTTWSFTVGQPVGLTLSPLAGTVVRAESGLPFQYQFTASGGRAPFTFTASDLPQSLILNPNTGLLSGTPPAIPISIVGSFRVRVQDAQGQTIQQRYPYTILPAPPSPVPPLALSPSGGDLPVATASQPYTFQFRASGGTAPYTFSSSALPGGLTLNPNTGLLSGTPINPGAGTWNIIRFSVTDFTGSTVSGYYNLLVMPPTQ